MKTHRKSPLASWSGGKVVLALDLVRLPRVFAVVLYCLPVLTACGPPKPKASDYVGHWEGAHRSESGSEYPCHLHITQVGQSLVAKNEDQNFRQCESYAQVYSLSEDGAAKGGPMGMVTLLFDRANAEIIVSGIPTSRNLRKEPSYHEVRARFPGAWKKLKTDSGQVLADVLIIELREDGFAVLEPEGYDQFVNVSYDNGTIRGSIEMTGDHSTYRTPFSIKSTGANTMSYSDERGSLSFQKQ